MIMNVAILYDGNNVKTDNVWKNLNAYKHYSKHNIFYIESSSGKIECDLDRFDCIVVHYSVYLFFRGALSCAIQAKIRGYEGFKVYVAQDEQDNINIARWHYLHMGFNLVFTCGITDGLRKIVYPPEIFSNIEFFDLIPGYVDDMSIEKNVAPLSSRKYDIVYRGSNYGYQYGRLGIEKLEIGEKMKGLANNAGLKHDIEWEESKKILGKEWFDFLLSGRTTLITESGSSIVYFDDKKKDIIACKEKWRNSKSFNEFNARHKLNDGRYVIKAISPKTFEAISARTALICYEGEYSHIILPDIHYIPLKKDWSNIEEVLKRVKDMDYLDEITDRCYHDIINSKKYCYSRIIAIFDKCIENRMIKLKGNIGIQKDIKDMSLARSPEKNNFHKRQHTLKEKLLLNYYYEGGVVALCKYILFKCINKILIRL